MAELNRVARCYKCGAILQTANPKEVGYISPEIVSKYPEGLLLCNDCFTNERFNIQPTEAHYEESYQSILETVKQSKALVCYVIDLLSFEGSFITKLNEMIEGLDVLVVANKRDLLPDNIDDNALLQYVEHRLRVAKLKVKDVVLTSSHANYNIDLMYQKIVELANNRDVYFIGASISGKSSLISDLLKRYTNTTSRPVTVCTFKNTDLRGYKIPLTNKTSIYELPGTDITNSMLSKVERAVQNQIMPKKAIKPRKFTMHINKTIAFGGLAAIQLLSKEKTDVTCYASDSIEIKLKSIPGDKLIETTIHKGNIKPCSSRFTSFSQYDCYDFQITEEGSRDIGILGLGWINFTGKNQTFRIFVPKGVYVYTTRAKVIYVK